MNKYDSIINMPHPTSKKHPRMAILDRAAQFAPFSALTGYDAAIAETGRLTEKKPILSDDCIAELNKKLNMLRENLSDEPFAKIKFFKPDNRKSGGTVVEKEGAIIKIDSFYKYLLLTDGTKINIEDIVEIDF